MVSAFSGLFAISVFNFHNFYRILGQKHTAEFYLLIFTYDILSLLFCVWAGLTILMSYFNTTSVRFCNSFKGKITKLTFIRLKAKKMGVLVHRVVARTHDKTFILKVMAVCLCLVDLKFKFVSYSLKFSPNKFCIGHLIFHLAFSL